MNGSGPKPGLPAPMSSPNILLIMTDEERYPPPYRIRDRQVVSHTPLTAESIRSDGMEFHRHYPGSTACTPSRATLFTGQYPSLHGVSSTDGVAKQATDPTMSWLDPNSVPNARRLVPGRGLPHPLPGQVARLARRPGSPPGTHEGLMASDDAGQPIPEAVEAYKRADRLDPFGFSGWIGREPHGAAKSDCGRGEDGVFAEQVVELFDDLAGARRDGPWLAVASFVNPHDIAFTGDSSTTAGPATDAP